MEEYWMLVRKGKVQYFREPQGRKAFLVTRTHADAVKLAKFLQAPLDARPARIGSIAGETLAGHYQLAIDSGCTEMHCVNGWARNGEPAFKTWTPAHDKDR